MVQEEQNTEENRQVSPLERRDQKSAGGDFTEYDNLMKTVFSKEEVEAFYSRFLAANPLEEVLSRIA